MVSSVIKKIVVITFYTLSIRSTDDFTYIIMLMIITYFDFFPTLSDQRATVLTLL